MLRTSARPPHAAERNGPLFSAGHRFANAGNHGARPEVRATWKNKVVVWPRRLMRVQGSGLLGLLAIGPTCQRTR